MLEACSISHRVLEVCVKKYAAYRGKESTSKHVFIRLASLGGGPQAHVHMEGMKCRVLYLNLLGMNALFL